MWLVRRIHKSEAEEFFLNGITRVMHRLAEQAHPAFPVTIYYAFKQAESDGADGVASTGWETFLDAVTRAGFAVNATWPMRTERQSRSRGIGSNALASSIILVCRPRAESASTASRREFLTALKTELPGALKNLSSVATSHRLTWRKQPSVPAWEYTRATPESLTRVARQFLSERHSR